MLDPTASELHRLAAGDPSSVQRMAAELLRAREALDAADRLAERAYGHWSTHRLAMEYRAARRSEP